MTSWTAYRRSQSAKFSHGQGIDARSQTVRPSLFVTDYFWENSVEYTLFTPMVHVVPELATFPRLMMTT